MKIAYFDCASGISGDMTLGALVDAGAPLEAINKGVQSLGLAGVNITAVPVKKLGFRALRIDIQHEPEHKHRHLHHIEAMIERGELNSRQKELATRIFRRLGEAEAKVHGTTVEKVHFHEVGAVDSISDIVGTAIAIDLLGIERVIASPVPTGSGFITIAHGRVSIPAPATAELLQSIPVAASSVEAELTTPTGAAILSSLADSFGSLPAMRIQAIGYGAGLRDLSEQANLLRVLIGESSESITRESLYMVETNIDDSSAEILGYCAERLWHVGALDVSLAPIQMKKGRPGTKITVLCRPADADAIEGILFAETTTLGVRRWEVSRHPLERRAVSVETPWGHLQGIEITSVNSSTTFSPEYESCRAVAERHNVPLRQVYEQAHRGYRNLQASTGD